ncbi:unnamed protein product [Arabidopsis thaliana]|uniref:Precursor of CEP4 n=4 Tax=Arabidopsis TaxID=3701 RepID=PCEP4_ARATH|nr:copper amine oxidase family protein [Arabidopsis thaliana]Q3EBM6.1 RecName: Full=Precursor of CEP4; Short=PCEP4; Contains: RecName: Full=C-terminally encoded peptide 4; Short=CEP4; Flags: Precursor [Arabidopsis thaliana]KAG7638598.1 hypothetical protein ISN45_At02g030230 [Arabidopsis thaliana x Arabidopsis arenosa]KAG7643209.1 hypothetical protein ISN44_As02g030480 [Arabidopsis suecica]AEC09129.1 copper amine oxidase family protein [Arabidopsis thaliana]OAP07902.1 hypothetical protein AXX17|eukprot:NP_001318359.1 copper amine oxidase family protein [Arabidopsis thaliana]
MVSRGCSITVLFRFLIVLLVIQVHFENTKAARHAPVVSWSPPEPPKDDFVWYHKINRFKNIEQDAFRPTHQGPSQGIGHKNPPGAP